MAAEGCGHGSHPDHGKRALREAEWRRGAVYRIVAVALRVEAERRLAEVALRLGHELDDDRRSSAKDAVARVAHEARAARVVRRLRHHLLVHAIVEEELAGEFRKMVRGTIFSDLDIDVHRAPRVPAGVDRAEGDLAARI